MISRLYTANEYRYEPFYLSEWFDE